MELLKDLLTFIVPISGLIFLIVNDSPSRKVLWEVLQRFQPVEVYRLSIKHVLDMLDQFYGPVWDVKAFDRCFAIAVVHPFWSVLALWVVLGRSEVGGLEFFAAAHLNGWVQSLYLIGFILSLPLIGILRRWVSKTKILCYILSILGAISGTVSGVLFSVGILGWGGIIAAVGAIMASVAGPGYAIAALALVSAFSLLIGVDSAGSLVFLIFFVGLPLINGLMDFLSWAFSRSFLKEIIDHKGSVLVGVLHSLIDAGIAVAFMAGVSFFVPVLFQSIGALSIVDNSPFNPFLWGDLLHISRAEPWGDGFMITLMLITTLIPTILHLLLFMVGVVGYPFALLYQKFVERMREEKPEALIYRVTEVSLLMLAVLSSTTVAAGLYLGLFELTGLADELTELLYWIALQGGEFAHMLFGGPQPPQWQPR